MEQHALALAMVNYYRKAATTKEAETRPDYRIQPSALLGSLVSK
jgi:hypothetical protein